MRDGLFKNARIPPPFKTLGDTLGCEAAWEEEGPARLEQALLKVAKDELPSDVVKGMADRLCQRQMSLLGHGEAMSDLRQQMTLTPAAQICLEHFEVESRTASPLEALTKAVEWTLRDIVKAQRKGMDEHILTFHPDKRADFQVRFEEVSGKVNFNRIAASAIWGRYPNLPKIDRTPRDASFSFERP